MLENETKSLVVKATVMAEKNHLSVCITFSLSASFFQKNKTNNRLYQLPI